MNGDNLINVGTPEKPVLVSEKVLQPTTNEGNEVWENIANGTISLPLSALDNLIKKTEDENK